MKLKVLELFGGIGACSKALERLGIDYGIADYVEIDKYAVKSFNAIHNTNFEPQDICAWDKDIEVDLIMHGSPCQDFSLAGKQAGGDEGSGTRSSLMYETIRIVEKLKPKYVIWENVKNLLSKKHRHNFDAYLETMEQLGYTNYYQVLNSKDYGIPQNRERVFTVSIRREINKEFVFPEPQELNLKLKDMLEDNVGEKYYLSEELMKNIKASKENITNNEVVRKYGVFDTENSKHQAGSVYDENGLSPTLDTMQGGWRQPCIEIKNATKKGYQEAYEGDGVNISSRMKYQRGNVQKESIQTITTSGGNDRGVIVKENSFITKHYNNFINKKGYVPEMFNPYNETEIKEIAPTQSTYCGSSTSSATVLKNDGLRIRKLTPKECWRLMGFDDADYERATQVNSNAQLYKQAGNSIVVNVLEAILTNLLK